LAEASRVRELESNHEIVRLSVAVPMGAHEDFPNLREIFFVFLDDKELVGVGAAIGAHCHCLAAIDQFCAALAETLPPAAHLLRRASRGCRIPTFHRLHCPAVADSFSIHGYIRHWLDEGRSVSCSDGILARKLHTQRSN